MYCCLVLVFWLTWFRVVLYSILYLWPIVQKDTLPFKAKVVLYLLTASNTLSSYSSSVGSILRIFRRVMGFINTQGQYKSNDSLIKSIRQELMKLLIFYLESIFLVGGIVPWPQVSKTTLLILVTSKERESWQRGPQVTNVFSVYK
jgi:hypothetical protein